MGAQTLDLSEPFVAEVIGNPSILYRKAFRLEARAEVWERALDNPFLMGQIWAFYRFQPPYQVIQTDDGVHIVDPTGITGDLRQIESSHFARVFYGRATFNHWSVPSFFAADGVIVFGWEQMPDFIAAEVKIFMRGNNWISRAVMKMFSGILLRRIDSRFMRNLESLRIILRDIEYNPQKIREGLGRGDI